MHPNDASATPAGPASSPTPPARRAATSWSARSSAVPGPPPGRHRRRRQDRRRRRPPAPGSAALLAEELARLRVPHLDPTGSAWPCCSSGPLSDADLRGRPTGRSGPRGWRSSRGGRCRSTRALGRRALETRPRIVQAMFVGPRDRSVERAERACHRARRRLESPRAGGRAGSLYVASCSFLTVTYKALVAADKLAHFYDSPTRDVGVRAIPPAVLDEHGARRGSARSRSGCSATTARSTRSAATSSGCGAARGDSGRRRSSTRSCCSRPSTSRGATRRSSTTPSSC